MKRYITYLILPVVLLLCIIGCEKAPNHSTQYDDQSFFDKYDFAGYPISNLKNLEVIGEDHGLFSLFGGIGLFTFIQGEENGQRWFGIFGGIHLIQYWKDDIGDNSLSLAEITKVIYTPEWAYIIVNYSKEDISDNYCPRIDAIYFDINQNNERTHFVDYKNNTSINNISEKWPAAIHLWSKNSVVVSYASLGKLSSAEVINFNDKTKNTLPTEVIPAIYYGLFVNHKEDCYTVFDINANIRVTGYQGYTNSLEPETFELFTPWLSDLEPPKYAMTSYNSTYYSQRLSIDIKQIRANGNTDEKEIVFEADDYIGDFYSVDIIIDKKFVGSYKSW